MTNRMATVTASLTLAGRLPRDFWPEARCARDRGGLSARVAPCGPVRAPLCARARVLVPSALLLSVRAWIAEAAAWLPRRPPAGPSGPPISGLGRAGGTPGRDGPAPGLAGAV